MAIRWSQNTHHATCLHVPLVRSIETASGKYHFARHLASFTLLLISYCLILKMVNGLIGPVGQAALALAYRALDPGHPRAIAAAQNLSIMATTASPVGWLLLL